LYRARVVNACRYSRELTIDYGKIRYADTHHTARKWALIVQIGVKTGISTSFSEFDTAKI
jgi:hypothetical protein